MPLSGMMMESLHSRIVRWVSTSSCPPSCHLEYSQKRRKSDLTAGTSNASCMCTCRLLKTSSFSCAISSKSKSCLQCGTENSVPMNLFCKVSLEQKPMRIKCYFYYMHAILQYILKIRVVFWYLYKPTGRWHNQLGNLGYLGLKSQMGGAQ